MKEARIVLKRFFIWMFVKLQPDDAANGSWAGIIAFTLLGLVMFSLFGYVFMQILSETGNIIPPLIFSGLMSACGIFLIVGSFSEISKKIINCYFPTLAA